MFGYRRTAVPADSRHGGVRPSLGASGLKLDPVEIRSTFTLQSGRKGEDSDVVAPLPPGLAAVPG